MVTCGLYNLGKVESVQNFEIGWWEGHPTLKVRFLNNRVKLVCIEEKYVETNSSRIQNDKVRALRLA